MPKPVPNMPFYVFTSRENRTQWRHVLNPVDDDAYFAFERSVLFAEGPEFPPPELRVYACTRPLRKPQLHEDMPWCLHGVVVSARLRNLLERMQPGSVRHAPITVRCDACTALGYSQVWVDHEIDCFDRERSRWRTNEDRIEISSLVVDPTRVPAASHVFRVKHHYYNQILVARAFFEEYTRLGMTGCCFPDTRSPFFPADVLSNSPTAESNSGPSPME